MRAKKHEWQVMEGFQVMKYQLPLLSEYHVSCVDLVVFVLNDIIYVFKDLVF